MSAEVLREAAALMRERAEAVGEGPWESYALPDAGPKRWTMTGVGVVDDEMGHRIEAMFPADATHVASWHPAVALAVADWLDWCAQRDAFNGRALAVARAYLGGTR
jgi:hypothetical protein